MPLSFPSSLKQTFWIGITTCIALTGCKDNEKVEPAYSIPTTYNFENVNYSGQSARLQMLEELVDYIGSADAPGATLDEQRLKDMYANQNGAFTNAALNNASGKQLKNKTFVLDQQLVEDYLEKVAAASASTVPGSNGVAGLVTSNDGTRKYLLDENGIDLAELIEKTLMGAVFYYQATDVYLNEEKTGDAVNNTTITPGEGTPMEHHWDEAFGYLGVPVDFPANTSGLQFWGAYINRRDAQLSSNAKIMNAFIKGRAAISNKDMKTKNEAIAIIRNEWEKVSAATAISYLNRAKTNLTDDAIRNHVLTEAIGFITALKYNPTKKISGTQLEQVLGFIGSNLYEVTAVDLDNAKNLLASIYGLEGAKDTL